LRTVVFTMVLATIFLMGCAFDLAHVSFTPTVYTPKSDKSFRIREAITISGSPCGYDRDLSKGTTWTLVGTVPEGEVYKSKDQVLSVECSNIHEAYLVISQDSVVGFYLPVEKGFVKLNKAITLNIEWGGK
jgi:hypothetical protein